MKSDREYPPQERFAPPSPRACGAPSPMSATVLCVKRKGHDGPHTDPLHWLTWEGPEQ